MQEWWRTAYVQEPNSGFEKQFFIEAKASLPMLSEKPELLDVFTSLQIQQMRLKCDQGVPEWTGTRTI
jgi:hypothetical protein